MAVEGLSREPKPSGSDAIAHAQSRDGWTLGCYVAGILTWAAGACRLALRSSPRGSLRGTRCVDWVVRQRDVANASCDVACSRLPIREECRVFTRVPIASSAGGLWPHAAATYRIKRKCRQRGARVDM